MTHSRQHWWRRHATRWTRGRRNRAEARDNFKGTWWAERDRRRHEIRTATGGALLSLSRWHGGRARWGGLEAWLDAGRLRRRLLDRVDKWAESWRK